jgi:hypothetical protein
VDQALRIGVEWSSDLVVASLRRQQSRTGHGDGCPPPHAELCEQRLDVNLFWVYLAQALAGSVIGFTAPFLYYFGVL